MAMMAFPSNTNKRGVGIPRGGWCTEICRMKKCIGVQVQCTELFGSAVRYGGGCQDGLCGNFNGDSADDNLEMIEERDPRVHGGESLF